MMKFKLEMDLGFTGSAEPLAIQTGADIIRSIKASFEGEESLPLEVGVAGALWDVSGNTVGKWAVIKDEA
jgi:hypothetical protein